MRCPWCEHPNLQGSDICGRCHSDLTRFNRPVGQDAVESSLLRDPVRSIPRLRPQMVSADLLLGTALQQMIDNEIGSLLVIDIHNRLIGIVTERDYLNRVIGSDPDEFNYRTVREVMTDAPDTVRPNDPIGVALRKMTLGGYRHLPVVDDGYPVGIISVRDILRHVMRLCRDT